MNAARRHFLRLFTALFGLVVFPWRIKAAERPSLEPENGFAVWAPLNSIATFTKFWATIKRFRMQVGFDRQITIYVDSVGAKLIETWYVQQTRTWLGRGAADQLFGNDPWKEINAYMRTRKILIFDPYGEGHTACADNGAPPPYGMAVQLVAYPNTEA